MVNLNAMDYDKGNEWDELWSEGNKMKMKHNHWSWWCNKNREEIEWWCYVTLTNNGTVWVWKNVTETKI